MKFRANAIGAGCALWIALLASGCASYTTPGSGVSIPEITSPKVAQTMSAKPAAAFPARIAVVRVQGSGYQSYTNRSAYGRGAFCVITTRDIETDADYARRTAMPGVAGLAAMSRLLLPVNIESIDDLRVAAGALQADMIMLYTFDTAFHTDTKQIGPLQLVTMGFFPNKKARVSSTVAVAFIDTRTGFIYGVTESTVTEEQRSDYWNKEEAIERARVRAERGAFTASIGEIEMLWASITAQHVKPAGAGGAAVSTGP
jgi:hypothetical protein